MAKINHAAFALISCSGISKPRTVGELAPYHFTDEPLTLSFPDPKGHPKSTAEPLAAEAMLSTKLGALLFFLVFDGHQSTMNYCFIV